MASKANKSKAKMKSGSNENPSKAVTDDNAMQEMENLHGETSNDMNTEVKEESSVTESRPEEKIPISADTPFNMKVDNDALASDVKSDDASTSADVKSDNATSNGEVSEGKLQFLYLFIMHQVLLIL